MRASFSARLSRRRLSLVIHIAVLLRPYLDLILAGKKTVECRLTIQARDPFERIERGERIYFKQSSGPFAATAIADEVLFEGDLTPRRVQELNRDYNHLVLGEDGFWKLKRDSRFCTLIWLKDVQPISSGPHHAPLQGRAWLSLDEEPAWRSTLPKTTSNPESSNGTFSIEITPGNIRNNTLYATSVIQRFPAWTIGGATRASAAKPMTLILHEGPTIQSDIVGSRKLLRTRVWGTWFRRHSVRAGDRVLFTPVNRHTFAIGLVRGGG
jgi:hypothetical protein